MSVIGKHPLPQIGGSQGGNTPSGKFEFIQKFILGANNFDFNCILTNSFDFTKYLFAYVILIGRLTTGTQGYFGIRLNNILTNTYMRESIASINAVWSQSQSNSDIYWNSVTTSHLFPNNEFSLEAKLWKNNITNLIQIFVQYNESLSALGFISGKHSTQTTLDRIDFLLQGGDPPRWAQNTTMYLYGWLKD